MKDTDDILDRDRGILTNSDREFLLGEISYDGQQLRNRRGDIRKRIENALIDFTLLKQLESRDRKLISNQISTDSPIYHGMINSIRFLYLLSLDANVEFENLLEEAIRDAEKEYSGNELVDLDLSKEFASDKTDELYAKAKRKSLSEQQKTKFIKSIADMADIPIERIVIHQESLSEEGGNRNDDEADNDT